MEGKSFRQKKIWVRALRALDVASTGSRTPPSHSYVNEDIYTPADDPLGWWGSPASTQAWAVAGPSVPLTICNGSRDLLAARPSAHCAWFGRRHGPSEQQPRRGGWRRWDRIRQKGEEIFECWVPRIHYWSQGRWPAPSDCLQVRKPLVEKKRRARINKSLQELRLLIADTDVREHYWFKQMKIRCFSCIAFPEVFPSRCICVLCFSCSQSWRMLKCWRSQWNGWRTFCKTGLKVRTWRYITNI